jgi:predicted enzyme related to lactoylglutathione lyase
MRTIRELGGKLWVEPRDIPGIGRFAVAADPQGASFAVFRRLTNAA